MEWRRIDEDAKRQKRVDLWVQYPNPTRNGRMGARVPNCYWHKRDGWKADRAHERNDTKPLQRAANGTAEITYFLVVEPPVHEVFA